MTVSDPIEVCGFTFIPLKELENEVTDPKIYEAISKSYNEENTCYIALTVEARDNDQALSKGDEIVASVHSVLSYALSNNGAVHAVNINNSNLSVGSFTYLKANGVVDAIIYIGRSTRPIKIDSSTFSVDNYSHLFDLICKQERNDFENRILKAVSWYTKGLAETNPDAAIIDFAISIEVLFKYDERDTLSKSVTATYAEYAAFLLGNDYVSRSDIESKFKKAYGLRSGITHGKQSSSTNEDMCFVRDHFADIINACIVKCSSGIQSTKELADETKCKRYS